MFARLDHDTTFEEFVWDCAREFCHRPSSWVDPSTEELTVDDFHRRRLRLAEEEVAAIDAMTEADAARAIENERDDAERINLAYREEFDLQKSACEAMMKRVREWEPPSPDHEKLKTFMEREIGRLAPVSPYQCPPPIEDPAEWLANEKRIALAALGNRAAEYAEELNLIRRHNDWVRVLRESVPQPEKTEAN